MTVVSLDMLNEILSWNVICVTLNVVMSTVSEKVKSRIPLFISKSNDTSSGFLSSGVYTLTRLGSNTSTCTSVLLFWSLIPSSRMAKYVVTFEIASSYSRLISSKSSLENVMLINVESSSLDIASVNVKELPGTILSVLLNGPLSRVK